LPQILRLGPGASDAPGHAQRTRRQQAQPGSHDRRPVAAGGGPNGDGHRLLRQRLRRAQHLLESTSEPVERVASLCGLGSAANLRQHFTRVVGVPPASYRRTFRHGTYEPDTG
jgi:hypothetical protein